MQTAQISDRLRALRHRHGYTTQEMADMTGVSKRTLDSYMRREEPPLPGLDALKKMAEGLGVSLDWLVFGEEHDGARAYLLARMAAESAALPFLKNLYEAFARHEPRPEPSYIAMEIGTRTGELAQACAEYGLTWKFNQAVIKASERDLVEFLKVRIAELQDELAKAKDLGEFEKSRPHSK